MVPDQKGRVPFPWIRILFKMDNPKSILYTFCNLILFLAVIVACRQSDRIPVPNDPSIRYTQKLDEIDGPYIYGIQDSITVITVESDTDSLFFIRQNTLKKSPGLEFTCTVSHPDKDRFQFSLAESHPIPESVYEQPERMFVTSDIEGNFDAFYGLLVANGVMDKKFDWTFGKGHLVICGDMVDRGNNSWPCLWLLYKLEQDAEKHGGKVHYILGNHDVMNMQGNLKYVRKRYIELAKVLSGKEDEKEAWFSLLSDNNELVRWIATKNSMEKIGKNLFVHGGISIDMGDADLSIDQVNDIVRKSIRDDVSGRLGKNSVDDLVFGKFGPLWYRGLVKDYKEHYKKMSASDLDALLKYYEVERVIIGHTIVDDEISTDYNGKVIRVDIKHPNAKFNGRSQGLLYENNTFFKVTDTGKMTRLDN